jgi:hypothetical protein
MQIAFTWQGTSTGTVLSALTGRHTGLVQPRLRLT